MENIPAGIVVKDIENDFRYIYRNRESYNREDVYKRQERVLTLKANYFTEFFGYEIHIILTDGENRPPYYELHPNITIHQLGINYDCLLYTSIYSPM